MRTAIRESQRRKQNDPMSPFKGKLKGPIGAGEKAALSRQSESEFESENDRLQTCPDK